MRIKHKLFLLILTANISLALVMYVLTLRSFSDGFNHYVENLENQKLKPFISALIPLYNAQGNWEWVHSQHDKWRFLINKHIQNLPRRPNNPEHHRRPRHDRPPPRRPPPPNRNNNLLVINSRLYLKDQENQLVIGNSQKIDSVHWISIVNNDEILGYVGYIKTNTLKTQLDQLFIQEQQRNFLFIALLLIFLSTLFALPAASLFLRPLNRVNKMLKQLTKGNFNQQLTIRSQDEIGDLSKDLNALAITLEKNRQARQQWIADISHELRTPVAILKGEIEAMQDGIRAVTNDALLSLQHEIERLSRLINDLHELTLTDIGALSYHKEKFDFCEVLRERIDAQKNNLQKSQLNVNVCCPHPPIELIGDVKRLEQLIDNLLQNTLRYTDKQGCLKVSLTRQDEKYMFIWEDSSPGVSDQDLEKLTEPLYRAEQSRSRHTGGSGLGLAICQKIVEAHHGTMTIEHSILGGITIIITFSSS